MTLTLNRDQTIAREAIMDFVESRENTTFVMAGLAGTGKTTLVCDILHELKSSGVRCAVVAPTGKAATVLNSKQPYFKASTIHKLLYKHPNDVLGDLIDRLESLTASAEYAIARNEPIEGYQDEIKEVRLLLETEYRKRNRLTFSARDPDEVRAAYDVIFVDEASMVSKDLVRDIGNLQLPTVYLGDPNQLYPVNEKEFAVRLDRPNVALTEIMRQAAGSIILPFSREILKAGGLPRGKLSVPHARTADPLYYFDKMGADTQYIVYMNKTRHYVNAVLRDRIIGDRTDPKYSFLPVVGERLMIDANAPHQGMMKGDIITVEQITDYKPDKKRGDYLFSAIVTDRIGVRQALRLHCNDLMLTTGDQRGVAEQRGNRSDSENARYHIQSGATHDGIRVQFPYAITCHKAQGSEWDGAVVYNDAFPAVASQYFYTAVTRARTNLMIANAG